MICSVCNHRNAADAAFCAQCGTALTAEAVTGQTVRIPAANTQSGAEGARVYQTPSSAPAYNQAYPTYAGPQQSQAAIIALVLGLLSFFGFSLFTAIPAIIVGRNALNDIRASNGQVTGDGLAQTGVVLGWINVGVSVLGFIAFCAVFALPFLFLPFSGY